MIKNYVDVHKGIKFWVPFLGTPGMFFGTLGTLWTLVSTDFLWLSWIFNDPSFDFDDDMVMIIMYSSSWRLS